MGRTLKDRKLTYEDSAFPPRWYVPVAKLGTVFNRHAEGVQRARVPRTRADQRSERGAGAHRSYRDT